MNYSNPRKYLHKDFERIIHSTRKTTAGGGLNEVQTVALQGSLTQ